MALSVSELLTLPEPALRAAAANDPRVRSGEFAEPIRLKLDARPLDDAVWRVAAHLLEPWLDSTREHGRKLDFEAAARWLAERPQPRGADFLAHATGRLVTHLPESVRPALAGPDPLRTLCADTRVKRRFRFKALTLALLFADEPGRAGLLEDRLVDPRADESVFLSEDRVAFLYRLGWLGVAQVAEVVARLGPTADVETLEGLVWALNDLAEADAPLVGPRYRSRPAHLVPLEQRALELLDDEHARGRAIAILGTVGRPETIGALRPLSKGWFRAGHIKRAARAAIEAIQARGAPTAGALALVEGAAGALSITRRADLMRE